MSTAPEQMLPEPDENSENGPIEVSSLAPVRTDSWPPEVDSPGWEQNGAAVEHVPVAEPTDFALEPHLAEKPLFDSYTQPRYIAPRRIPNFGHVAILVALLFAGWLAAGSLLVAGLHMHVFGVSSLKQAVNDYRFTLGSQAIQYLVTLLLSVFLFPLVWHKGFFAGVHWRGATALRNSGQLISAALLCFVLAMVNGYLMPGPTDAPIDKIFRVPGAAWVLFAFGVTMAPFFEELAFRGFLLPAICTAYDWLGEQMAGTLPRPLDENGHPQWSIRAMVVGSVLTSVPFALMHGEQTSYSLGPFLLLICVSLVLCWARLKTRSLAASVMVHACYNFVLFSLMLWGTGGFKHLDNM